jgi:predicted RNase H-like HicB family nuclease
MVTHFPIGQSQADSPLQVTLLLETLASGKVVASIFEFPSCRVEADTKESAIAQLQAAFLERLQHIEAIPWTIPTSLSKPAWTQFAGVFQDDPDFQAIMAAIQAERNSDDDSEVDPTYYQ